MTKQQALDLIDAHKNQLTDPRDMLNWSWLRVIILKIPERQWEIYLNEAITVLSQ